MRTRIARRAGTLLAWVVAAGAATFAGVIIVGAIGSGIVPPAEQPLTPAEVTQRLAQLPDQPTTTTPTPPSDNTGTGTPPPDPSTAAGTPVVFNSAGGTILARCNRGPEVVSAIPAQGYRVKDIEPEEGGARVRFESGQNRVEVRLVCVGGQPQTTIHGG